MVQAISPGDVPGLDQCFGRMNWPQSSLKTKPQYPRPLEEEATIFEAEKEHEEHSTVSSIISYVQCLLLTHTRDAYKYAFSRPSDRTAIRAA
jgi:hypothetical protein